VEGKIEFSDLMGSIINLKANRGEEDDEFNEDDFN
jgi:magnesium chelatase subunit I